MEKYKTPFRLRLLALLDAQRSGLALQALSRLNTHPSSRPWPERGAACLANIMPNQSTTRWGSLRALTLCARRIAPHMREPVTTMPGVQTRKVNRLKGAIEFQPNLLEEIDNVPFTHAPDTDTYTTTYISRKPDASMQIHELA